MAGLPRSSLRRPFKFQISNFNFIFQIANLKSQIPNLKSQISNFKFQISNFKSRTPNPKSQIPNRRPPCFISPKIWIFIYVSISKFQLSHFCRVQKIRRHPSHRTCRPEFLTARPRVSRLPPSLHAVVFPPSIKSYVEKNGNARCVFQPRKVKRLSSDFSYREFYYES